MNDDWDYDEPDGNWEDGYEWNEEEICACGRRATDNCGFCGEPLCYMCFECGAGFCSKPHTEEQIRDYEKRLYS